MREYLQRFEASPEDQDSQWCLARFKSGLSPGCSLMFTEVAIVRAAVLQRSFAVTAGVSKYFLAFQPDFQGNLIRAHKCYYANGFFYGHYNNIEPKFLQNV